MTAPIPEQLEAQWARATGKKTFVIHYMNDAANGVLTWECEAPDAVDAHTLWILKMMARLVGIVPKEDDAGLLRKPDP